MTIQTSLGRRGFLVSGAAVADELAALAPARPTVLAADLRTDDGVASIEAWMDETHAQVDALALGWRPQAG
jgi:hypothetical protein